MDRANRALSLIAEGKLNLKMSNNVSVENEMLKIKSFRNNIIIGVLSVVIFGVLVF